MFLRNGAHIRVGLNFWQSVKILAFLPFSLMLTEFF